MFTVGADKSKNLLTISYSQQVGVDEAKEGAAQIKAVLPLLQPGFRLLTDMTNLQAMDRGCIPIIRQIMQVLNKHGIKLVVRVIPDPGKDIGLNILSLFHYRREV